MKERCAEASKNLTRSLKIILFGPKIKRLNWLLEC